MGYIEDLHGEFVYEKGQKIILLKWTNPQIEFNQHEGIALHASLSSKSAFRKVAKAPINSGSYRYHIDYFFARTYYLMIRSYKSGKTFQSNIITVDVPTLELPIPRITSIKRSSKSRIMVEWSYPFNIPDLMGFVLFINGRQICSLSKWTRHKAMDIESFDPMYILIKVWTKHANAQSKPYYLNANLP